MESVEFHITVDMPADEVERTGEPYYVTLDIEGKVYDVTDIRRVDQGSVAGD